MADPKDPKDAESDEAEEAEHSESPEDAPEEDEEDEEDEAAIFASLPGRPIGPDELDPELMKLSKPRTRIGWLLSLSVVALCAYVMFEMRSDLSFSREPDQPRIIDSARKLTETDTDSFVAVRAVPDRAYAARVLESKSSMGERLYPVFGTDDHVWLLISGSPWDDKAMYSEVWAGRVRRIDDLPFSDSLRAYLAKSPARPRFLSPERLRTALAEKAASVTQPNGDTVPVAADTEVVISERVRGQSTVTVTRSDSYKDESQWRAALTRAGLITNDTQPITGDGESWTYQIDREVESVRSALTAARLIAEVEPVARDHRGTWGQLAAAGGDIRIGDESVAWTDVTRVSLFVKRGLPDNATVLVASDHPGDYWFMLPVFVLLALFAALFAWSFARAIRGDEPVTESQPAAT